MRPTGRSKRSADGGWFTRYHTEVSFLCPNPHALFRLFRGQLPLTLSRPRYKFRLIISYITVSKPLPSKSFKASTRFVDQTAAQASRWRSYCQSRSCSLHLRSQEKNGTFRVNFRTVMQLFSFPPPRSTHSSSLIRSLILVWDLFLWIRDKT